MKKQLRLIITIFGLAAALQGCTQVVTAPVALAGTAVSTTLDVAGSAVDAVIPGD